MAELWEAPLTDSRSGLRKKRLVRKEQRFMHFDSLLSFPFELTIKSEENS